MHTVPRLINSRDPWIECRGTDASVQVLTRIPVESVTQLSPVLLTHAFGDTADITELKQVAGYDCEGKLIVILEKTANGWQVVPIVKTVKQTAYPAMCLIFQDVRAQNSFLTYLQQVQNETIHNPSVALMLSTLKIAPYTTMLTVTENPDAD